MATDIEDVIDAIEDALNLAEKMRESGSDGDNSKVAAREAIDQIRRGEHANAITTLEREFFPKWQSTEGCRLAWAKHKAAA